jgi:hypothetical protein
MVLVVWTLSLLCALRAAHEYVLSRGLLELLAGTVGVAVDGDDAQGYLFGRSLMDWLTDSYLSKQVGTIIMLSYFRSSLSPAEQRRALATLSPKWRQVFLRKGLAHLIPSAIAPLLLSPQQRQRLRVTSGDDDAVDECVAADGNSNNNSNDVGVGLRAATTTQVAVSAQMTSHHLHMTSPAPPQYASDSDDSRAATPHTVPPFSAAFATPTTTQRSAFSSLSPPPTTTTTAAAAAAAAPPIDIATVVWRRIQSEAQRLLLDSVSDTPAFVVARKALASPQTVRHVCAAAAFTLVTQLLLSSRARRLARGGVEAAVMCATTATLAASLYALHVGSPSDGGVGGGGVPLWMRALRRGGGGGGGGGGRGGGGVDGVYVDSECTDDEALTAAKRRGIDRLVRFGGVVATVTALWRLLRRR